MSNFLKKFYTLYNPNTAIPIALFKAITSPTRVISTSVVDAIKEEKDRVIGESQTNKNSITRPLYYRDANYKIYLNNLSKEGITNKTDLKRFLIELGVKPDGVWRPLTQAAYERYLNNEELTKLVNLDKFKVNGASEDLNKITFDDLVKSYAAKAPTFTALNNMKDNVILNFIPDLISYAKHGNKLPKYQNGRIITTGGAYSPGYSFLSRPIINELQSNLGHAIYLHYPNFEGLSKNAIKVGNTDLGEVIGNPTIPVGHAAAILIDPNRNATYYEYGRYESRFGNVRPPAKGGNWRKIKLGKQRKNENDSVFVRRMENKLPYTNTGDYLAMTVQNIDTKNAKDWVESEANNKNRKLYSIFNTCANGACNAIFPFLIVEDYNPDEKSNESGYSIKSKLWSLIPNSTGANARTARSKSSKIYNMTKQ